MDGHPPPPRGRRVAIVGAKGPHREAAVGEWGAGGPAGRRGTPGRGHRGERRVDSDGGWVAAFGPKDGKWLKRRSHVMELETGIWEELAGRDSPSRRTGQGGSICGLGRGKRRSTPLIEMHVRYKSIFSLKAYPRPDEAKCNITVHSTKRMEKQDGRCTHVPSRRTFLARETSVTQA